VRIIHVLASVFLRIARGGRPCYFRRVQYTRHLPHWFPDGPSIFLTWRLYGSLSVAQLDRIHQESALPDAKPFKLLDAALDRPTRGPMWLANPAIAKLVCARMVHHADILHHYQLDAYAVMANHIHILIVPLISVPRIMNSLKTRTARAANEALRRTGLRFWQAESFDRWCRNEEEVRRVRRYIEHNPVKAGLVRRPEDYPWSSAARVG
jgi:putative transposase